MQIQGWQIDGFGLFVDYRVTDLSSGITVFLGPNEAGKSTLLAFLRGMLFGFPTGRSAEKRHEPLHTRHMGGKLYVDTPLGPYTIQRTGDRKEGFKLYRPDDTPGSESELAALLGHADQGLFKSVFAFSLSELQNLDVHKEEGIKDRIFAGSLQGGRNTAREALTTLDKQNASVFKPRGREVELVKLAKQLEAAKGAVDEARKQALAYEGLVQQEAHLDTRIEGFTREQAELQIQVQRHRSLLDLWPKWLERTRIQQALDSQDSVETFPTGGEARLAELLSMLKAQEATLTDLRLEQSELQTSIEAIPLDDALNGFAERLTGMAAETSRFLEWVQGLAESVQRRCQAQAKLDDGMAALGKDWTRARLEAFDASVLRVDEVAVRELRLETASKDLAEAMRDVKEAVRQAETATAAVNDLRRRLAQEGEASSPEALSAAEERLIRIKSDDTVHRELLAEERQLGETLRSLEIEFLRAPSGERPALPGAVKGGLWGIALLLASGAAWKAIVQDVALALLLAVTAAVLAGLSRMRGNPPVGDARAKQFIQEQLQQAKARQAELQLRLDGVQARLRENGRALGIGEHPSSAEIEALARRLAQEHEIARARALLLHDFDRLEAQAAEAAQKSARLQKTEDGSRQALEAAEQSWREWREAAGIMEDRSPRGVTLLFQALEVARQQLGVLKAHEADEQALERKVSDFRGRASSLLRAMGEDAPAADELLVHALARLQARLLAAGEARERQASLRRELASVELKLEARRSEQAVAQQALEALYAEAGAAGEADFLQRMERYSRQQEMKRAQQQLDHYLDEQLGRDDQAQTQKERLKTEDIAGWNRAITEAEISLAELAGQRDAVNQELGRLQEERRKLEVASDVIAREHAYQALRDEFQRQARAWMVRGLAEDLIQEALTEVERTRQPAVLAHASGLFSRVTAERYVRLAQHEGGEFHVIDRQSNRIPVEKLSRGTAEQLYLCLRLGLIREFAKQATHLPLIMDDVFVNFDPERAKRVAELLVDFASEHQVLLFTCHPQTADLLREADSRIRLVTMPRYGLPAPQEV